MKKGMQLKDVVENMIRPIGKTLRDVFDVNMNHPTDPTELIIIFRDGTQATVSIQRPLQ